MTPLQRSRLTIIGVVVLFMTPVLVAIYLNSSFSSWAPTTTRNFGHLLQPPVPIAGFKQGDQSERWMIILDAREGCDARCMSDLDLLRQIEKAMGRNADRAERAAILGPLDDQSQAVLSAFPDLKRLTTSSPESRAIEQLLAKENRAAGVFLVDPRGFLVMTYPRPLDGTALRKDLNHLLKWTEDA